jgi:type I restriction enzyme S subunit
MSVDYLNLCLQRYDFIPLTSGTTNRRKLTKVGLLDAKFMVAPLAEQSRIVNRVNELRSLCADLRQRLAFGQAVQSRLADALVTG